MYKNTKIKFRNSKKKEDLVNFLKKPRTSLEVMEKYAIARSTVYDYIEGLRNLGIDVKLIRESDGHHCVCKYLIGNFKKRKRQTTITLINESPALMEEMKYRFKASIVGSKVTIDTNCKKVIIVDRSGNISEIPV